MTRTTETFMVTVRDTGVGIPADALPHIFDQFYQSEPVATRKHEGLGLGLSIAKGLVELHCGNISVESTPDVGTTLAFSLPVRGPLGP